MSYPNWSKNGKGSDRVLIFEDTDGDGTFDKKTVKFMDNGGEPLRAIEIGFGGVWLCSSPNLLFVPILEGDKPGKPEVVLDGWNMIDTKHNIFNSLGWGPDGWLYGCNGIQAKAWVGPPGTPKEKRTYLDCGVWRYHPTRKVFELVASGTTNPFGLDWDEYGEMFITNCVIDHLFNFVPGGHYERMYGQDANPYVYGLMKSCVDYKHWAGGDWTTSVRSIILAATRNSRTRAAVTLTRAARSTSATTSPRNIATRSSPATYTATALTTTAWRGRRAATRGFAARISCSRTTRGSAASA